MRRAADCGHLQDLGIPPCIRQGHLYKSNCMAGANHQSGTTTKRRKKFRMMKSFSIFALVACLYLAVSNSMANNGKMIYKIYISCIAFCRAVVWWSVCWLLRSSTKSIINGYWKKTGHIHSTIQRLEPLKKIYLSLQTPCHPCQIFQIVLTNNSHTI